MKSKTLILAVFLCSGSALAADWDKIGSRFKDAGDKIIEAVKTAGNKAKEAVEPHLESIANILAQVTEDAAEKAEKVTTDL